MSTNIVHSSKTPENMKKLLDVLTSNPVHNKCFVNNINFFTSAITNKFNTTTLNNQNETCQPPYVSTNYLTVILLEKRKFLKTDKFLEVHASSNKSMDALKPKQNVKDQYQIKNGTTACQIFALQEYLTLQTSIHL